MNAQYYIDKFSAIPDDQWRTDGLYGKDGEPHCVLGHLGMRGGVNALYWVLDPVFSALGGLTNINDYASTEFPQLTPKARILAALESAKALYGC